MDTNYVDQYSGRVESQMAQVEGNLRAAMEIGDTEAAVKAQKEMATLAVEADRAEQAKRAQERKASVSQQPQPQVQPQARPQPPDPKQLWHTESYYNNGSNHFGFGNAETDKLIEDIRLCMDKGEMRDKMYLLQEEIHNTIPCVFLYSLKNKIVIHNRFKEAKAYSSNPGYWEGELKVSLN